MTEYLEPPQAVAAAEHLGFRIRDRGLLFSAIGRPAGSMFGEDAYPSIEMKAAVLLESLARDHPLFDGNKRFSWYLVLAFLRINGLRLVMPEDEAFDLILGVAQGSIDPEASAAAIAARLAAR